MGQPPNKQSIPPDERTKKLITVITSLLGMVSEAIACIDGLSQWIGLEKPELAGILGILLLFVALSINPKEVLEFLKNIRGAIANNISGLTLAISVVILLVNAIMLIEVYVILKNSSKLAPYSSTKFVGVFPGGIPTIIQLIHDADESVDVLTDHLAYGALSDPEQFGKYRTILIDKATSAQVTIIGFDNKTLNNSIESQFNAQLADVGSQQDFFDPKSPRWIKFFRKNKDYPQPTDLASFKNLIEKKNKEVGTGFSNLNISVRSIANESPILMWIVDKKVAVFAFHNHDGKEIALLTSDPQIVSMLYEMFTHYLTMAVAYQ